MSHILVFQAFFNIEQTIQGTEIMDEVKSKHDNI